MSGGLERNMDNENKVKGSQEGTNIFLQNAVVESGGAPDLYSLESEFAKAKKNKKTTAYLLLALFLIAIVGASFLGSIYIQNLSQKTDIDIKDFEDLNLEQLLGSAKKIEYQLNQLRAEADALKKKQQEKLYSVKDAIALEKQIVLTSDIPRAEKEAHIKELDKKLERQLAGVTSQYKNLINEKEIEIANLEAEYAQMDNEVMASAKQTETVMNSYQKLYELQLQKLRNDNEARIEQINNDHRKEIERIEKYNMQMQNLLILKYNPKFSVKQVLKEYGITDAITEASPKYKGNDKTFPRQWSWYPLLEQEKIMTQKEFNAMRSQLLYIDAILGRLDSVPYTNSVAPALDELIYLMALNKHTYENLWYSLATELSAKMTLLDYYRWALQSYSSENRESGYVLDARNKTNIIAFIDDIYEVEKGEEAIVFRGDQQFIARVSLTPLVDSVRLNIIEQSPSNSIKSLDKILILKQEAFK